MTYRPPLRDMEVALEAFGFDDRVGSQSTFSAFDGATVRELLTSGGAVVTREWQPLNTQGDRQGARLDTVAGRVVLPDGHAHAYQAAAREGLLSVCMAPQYGGSGAPEAVGVCVAELLMASHKSLSMCAQLSNGVARALMAHGTDAQRARYLPQLAAAQTTGTLSLTEPQCGSDLSLIRTRAEAQPDGSFRLYGAKTWITYGDHDAAPNVLHLVLARVEGAPAGLRGLTAFLVPKRLEDGQPNAIVCTGLEHKMGLNASPTCTMALDGAWAEPIGELHRGLSPVFSMLNMARLYVGLEGVALGEAAYQEALEFARTRRQGRAMDPRKSDRTQSADPILVHHDVRRKLARVRSTTLALRGLAVWLAIEHDASRTSDAQDAQVLVDVLTPVMKVMGSELGFENCSAAMQVLGGLGYTRDGKVEQHLRDVRVAMIYEGTNALLGLELVLQKLAADHKRALEAVYHRLETLEADSSCKATLVALHSVLRRSAAALFEARPFDPERLAAASSDFLAMLGWVVLVYVWGRLAQRGEPAYAGLDTVFCDLANAEVHRLAARLASAADEVRVLSQVNFDPA